VANILDVDAGVIPTETGWAYNEIIEGILRGKIRGLWVVCTNPAHSWINQSQCREILDRLDFLVVQDMYSTTETARMADLILPAAGWGEKEGTFINSERRKGVVKKVSRPPGEALSDFDIFRLVADYWGCAEMFKKWDSPAAVFDLMKQCSVDMPCDFSGIENYAQLVERGGIQWPYPQGATDESNQRRLFEDGHFFHEDGRARLLFEEPRPLPEAPNDRYPFILLTGRGSASQWHTQTRTSKSPVLAKLSPSGPFAEVNPADAKRLGIRANERVIITSQRGRIRVRAFLTNAVQPGQVFVPMHDESTNRLTDAVFDPYSKQPAYKACAVCIEKTG
jgi:assimilatory nitrate reductase catalytic subunit